MGAAGWTWREQGNSVVRAALNGSLWGWKVLLSALVNGQCGETESVFIKFACHARLGPRTEKGLWQTGEMG